MNELNIIDYNKLSWYHIKTMTIWRIKFIFFTIMLTLAIYYLRKNNKEEE